MSAVLNQSSLKWKCMDEEKAKKFQEREKDSGMSLEVEEEVVEGDVNVSGA